MRGGEGFGRLVIILGGIFWLRCSWDWVWWRVRVLVGAGTGAMMVAF